MYDTETVFKGKITNNRLFVADRQKMYDSHLQGLSGERVEIIIRKEKRKATTNQFKFYFGGIIKGTCMKSTLFAGWSAESIDHYFRYRYAFTMKKSNGKEQRETHDLALYSTDDMIKFIDQVIAELAQNGIEVLSPEEYQTFKNRDYFNS